MANLEFRFRCNEIISQEKKKEKNWNLFLFFSSMPLFNTCDDFRLNSFYISPFSNFLCFSPCSISFSNPLCLSHLSTFLTPTISVTPFRILALSCHKFHTFSLTELFPQNFEFLHWCTFYLDWSTVFLGLNFFLSLTSYSSSLSLNTRSSKLSLSFFLSTYPFTVSFLPLALYLSFSLKQSRP